MSEEIIIDGVNVAECKDYDDGTCCNDDVLTLSCEKTICIYKQLKSLQAENERLEEDKKRYELYIKQERDNNYKYCKALKEIKVISDNYNLTVSDRREQIANKINEVLDER